MKFTGMQGLAGACCLFVPLVLAAQGNPSDPMNPGVPNPMSSQSPSSQTSSQTTPGLARPNNAASSTFESSPTGAESAAQMMKDKMFLKDAAVGGMAEVQFGQLAAQKGNSDKVKEFGQKMVTDHTALNNNLKPFADKMGVTPPTGLSTKDQAEFDKLNGLSGDEFDKEYVSAMMKDHEKDLKDFRKEAATAGDPDLKAVVESGERVIARHHRMIDRIAASMNVTVASGS
jgi:putative membrane protein